MKRKSLLLATAALAIGWLLLRPPGLVAPLYDGIPLPPEPYRYLTPPPGANSQAPTSAEQNVNIETDTFFQVVTTEQPPQAQLIGETNSLIVPNGVSVVHVAVKPVPPPATLPADGRIDGNVYSITITAAGTAISLRNPVDVILRGPSGAGAALVEVLSGNRWQRIGGSSNQIALDTYEVKSSSLGDFALVLPKTGSQPTTRGGVNAGVIAAAVIACLLLGTIFAIRRLRKPRP